MKFCTEGDWLGWLTQDAAEVVQQWLLVFSLHAKPKEVGSNICGGCCSSKVDGFLNMRGGVKSNISSRSLYLCSQKVRPTFRVALSTSNTLIKIAITVSFKTGFFC